MFLRPRHVFIEDDTGQATVEYTIILIAAAAMAMVLFGIVKSGSVADGIADLVDRALDVKT
jgi:Flp pilus assembly pilin Flp